MSVLKLIPLYAPVERRRSRGRRFAETRCGVIDCRQERQADSHFCPQHRREFVVVNQTEGRRNAFVRS